MARFGRRRAVAAADAGEGDDWPDGTTTAATTTAVPAAATPKPDDGLPSSRLRGNEALYGQIVGGLIVVVSVVMLVVTKGSGAPKHPHPLFPSLGVAFGLATVTSVRVASNRMVTAVAAIGGGFVCGQAQTPNSIAGAKILALLAPVIYGVLIFQRQSKLDRTRRAGQPRMTPAERRAARNRGGTSRATNSDPRQRARPVPGRPQASGRYTPPKAKRRAH